MSDMNMPTGKRARHDIVDSTPTSTAAEHLHLDDPGLYECDSQGASRDEVQNASPDAEEAEQDPLHLHFLLVRPPLKS